MRYATVSARCWASARASSAQTRMCACTHSWRPNGLRYISTHRASRSSSAAGEPAPAGVIIMNPPYGERMGSPEELARFYPRLGDALKQRFAGWRCYIFTADLRLPKLIRLEPSRRTPLWNGALECRLYEFKIVSGSHRR